MEHLSMKPYFLTDEDILWIGTTLADMLPVECADAAQVAKAVDEGRAAMFVYDSRDATAPAHTRACIDAGAFFVRVGEPAAVRFLREEMGFNGLIIEGGTQAEETLREELIKFLSLQAALGLHNP